MKEKTLPMSDGNSGNSETSLARDETRLTEDRLADAHEVKVQSELNAQFRELKRQAQGIFDAVKGRIGARNEEYLQQVFTNARENYSSGQFLMQRIGADRQLDLPLVATLTQLRQSLIAEIPSPTASDLMLADSAILAYRNMLRIQGWIGSLSLQVQRDLFGQDSLSDLDGGSLAADVENNVRRLEATLLPLLERCQRMMTRAFDRLEARRSRGTGVAMNIVQSGQVSVGVVVASSVTNSAPPADTSGNGV